MSTLFAGNPNLIQGFNTFLPPGYRIECGTADDPNAIRVTTPMGTTVSPMGSHLRPAGDRVAGIVPPPFEPGRPDWHQSEQIEGILDPTSRAQVESLFAHQPGVNQARMSPFEASNNGPLLAQQEQRNVAQLQSAAAAANDPMMRQMTAASPQLDTNSPMQNGAGGLEKRGPVEFNHAISYVNKIKVCADDTHFSKQPLIHFRTGLHLNLRYTNSSLRFCKHISGNRNRYKMSTHRSPNCSMVLPISYWTSSNSCLNRPLKQRRPLPGKLQRR